MSARRNGPPLVVERPITKTAKTLRDARQWLKCSEGELQEAMAAGLLPVHVLLDYADAELLRAVKRQRGACLKGYFRIEEYVSDKTEARFKFGIVVAVDELDRFALVRKQYTLVADPRRILPDDLERYRREHLQGPAPDASAKPVRDDPKPTRRRRRSTLDRERCREFVSKYPLSDRTIIEAMIDRLQADAPGAPFHSYTRSTIHRWIADLFPNRRRGRPRKN